MNEVEEKLKGAMALLEEAGKLEREAARLLAESIRIRLMAQTRLMEARTFE